MARIAYLGPEGTFTEAALLQMTDAGLIPDQRGAVQRLPIDSTPAALDAVRDGEADYACVPIENSIDGSVMPTLDSLGDRFAAADVRRDDAGRGVQHRRQTRSQRRATSARWRPFPVAAAQVRQWLAAHLPGAELRPAYSNADAAQQVADGEVDAAVTSPLAVAHWGLSTLADGVVDEPNARTRFVLVGLPGPPPARTGADRTSVVLRIDNAPGALLAALAEFGIRDIDLTRIESRPTRTELGTYLFFIDCVGHIDDDAVAEALKALHRRCADVRYLGSWPTGAAAGAEPPPPDEASRWLARLRGQT